MPHEQQAISERWDDRASTVEDDVCAGAYNLVVTRGFDDCSASDAEQLYEIIERISDDIDTAYPDIEDNPTKSKFIWGIPNGVLNRIAASPNSAFRDRLLDVTETMMDSAEDITQMEGVIARARLLGYKDAIEYTIAWCEDPAIDPVVAEHDINLLYDLSYVLGDYPRTRYTDTIDNRVDEKYDFADRYVHGLLNMPEDPAAKMFEAMDERIHLLGGDLVDDREHIAELKNIYESCRCFTPEEITRIHEGAGIVNFGNYSEEQLMRMLRFVDRDKELMDELQNRPVMVCVKDAMGDHNTALSDTPDIFEGSSATTLFFEVSTAVDGLAELGRYADAMADAGVTYDTVVFAAHGFTNDKYSGSGGFKLGNAMIAAEGVYARRKSDAYPNSHDIFASKGLKKLFSGLTPNEVGEVDIMLLSCEQGSRKNKYQVATAEVLADFAQSCMDTPAACTVYALERSTNVEDEIDSAHIVPADGAITVAQVSASGIVRSSTAVKASLKGLMMTGEREDAVAEAGDWAITPQSR